MSNISGPSSSQPHKPSLDGPSENSSAAKSAKSSNTQAAADANAKGSITTTDGKGATSTASGNIQNNPSLPAPDPKATNPAVMAKATEQSMTVFNNRTLIASSKNMNALRGLTLAAQANTPDENKLSSKDINTVSVQLAAVEQEKPGSIKQSLSRTFTGENNLIKPDGTLHNDVKAALTDPQSAARKAIDSGNLPAAEESGSRDFDMFALLLLLDKLASVNYDAMRMAMRADQTEINAQFDEKKEKIMEKAVVGLVMGLVSAGISIAMVGVSLKQMKGAEMRAMEKTDPALARSVKAGNTPVDGARAQINGDPGKARNFSKNYHSEMLVGGVYQQVGSAAAQAVNAVEKFYSTMVDADIVSIDQAMSELRFSQDEARSLRQEQSKMEERASGAAKDIMQQKFAAIRAIAAKTA